MSKNQPLLKGEIPKNKRKWKTQSKDKFIYIFKVDLNLKPAGKENDNVPKFYLVKVGIVMAGYDALVRRLSTHKNNWSKQNILVSIPFNSDSIVDKNKLKNFTDLCSIIYLKNVSNIELAHYERYISSFIGLPFSSNILIDFYGKDVTPSEFVLMEASLFNKIRKGFLEKKLFMKLSDIEKLSTGFMCVKKASFILEGKWIDTQVRYFAKARNQNIFYCNKCENKKNNNNLKTNDDTIKDMNKNKEKELTHVKENISTKNDNLKNEIEENKKNEDKDIEIIVNTPYNIKNLIKNNYEPNKKKDKIEKHDSNIENPAFQYEEEININLKDSFLIDDTLLNDFINLKDELNIYIQSRKNEKQDYKKNDKIIMKNVSTQTVKEQYKNNKEKEECDKIDEIKSSFPSELINNTFNETKQKIMIPKNHQSIKSINTVNHNKQKSEDFFSLLFYVYITLFFFVFLFKPE